MNIQIVKWARLLNAIDVIAVCFVIFLAFIMQVVLNELPCPLCLLQRIGILAIGFGFLLNIRYQIRARHYAFSLLSAVFTGFAAVRQIALHILPGTPAYGLPLLGLHMYTWVFILSVICIIYTTFMLCIQAQFEQEDPLQVPPSWLRSLSHFAFLFFLSMLLLNILFTFLECGFKTCPENPVAYKITKLLPFKQSRAYS